MEPEIHQFDRPFLIEHNRLLETSKEFTPTARLHLTAYARTSGFLRVLSGNQARMLLALMTYLTPNGEIRATPTQVATALGIPTPVAALWLRQFARQRFQDEPVVQRLRWEAGLTVYTVSDRHIRHDNQAPKKDLPVIHYGVGRERVVAHVRSTYATPRAEAERTVMHHLGLHPEELEDTDDAQVWRELRYLRLKRADIQALIDTFGTRKIADQLAWLPDRRPKDRARTLVSALINNWGPPKSLHDVLRTGKYQTASSAIERANDNSSVNEEGVDEQ